MLRNYRMSVNPLRVLWTSSHYQTDVKWNMELVLVIYLDWKEMERRDNNNVKWNGRLLWVFVVLNWVWVKRGDENHYSLFIFFLLIHNHGSNTYSFITSIWIVTPILLHSHQSCHHHYRTQNWIYQFVVTCVICHTFSSYTLYSFILQFYHIIVILFYSLFNNPCSVQSVEESL